QTNAGEVVFQLQDDRTRSSEGAVHAHEEKPRRVEDARASVGLALGEVALVRRRLVPFLFLLYIVAYLDRINVGFAALQMNAALGFSASTYGFGAGIFFLSYIACEIPSNVTLARVGARVWIARIMISWGLISSAM